MIRRIALLLPLCTPTVAQDAPAPSASLSLEAPEWAAAVERWAEPLVRDQILAGVCIGVVQGNITWTQGFGQVSVDREVRPDEQTVFEIGSISKTFTGVLLADAILRGVVRAEDPVQNFAPEGCTLIERKAPVQLLHLANHTSGWPRLPMPFEPADLRNPYADFDEAKLWGFLCDHKPMRRPGRLYAYSNLGVGALGYLVAKAQEQSYSELLAERIVKPLGMTSTAVACTEAMRARLADPYNADLEPDALWDFDALTGAGGIRSNVRDMLIYARAAMGGREDGLGAAFTLSQKPTYEGRSGPVVGMGWHLHPERGLVTHNGQTGGYHSYLALHPETRTAVVVLANTATGEVDRLGDNLLRVLLGEEPQPYDYRAAIEVAPEVLQTYAGRYQLAPKMIFDITVDEDRLYAQLTGQPRLRLHAESPRHFFYRAVDAQITFEVDDDGRCAALTLHQWGDRRAKRLPEKDGQDR